MALEQFREFNFKPASLGRIAQCNSILNDFKQQGFDMTLRQLYYQLVKANIIPNNEKSYDNLGGLVSNARIAGLIDWDGIVDRTRSLRGLSHWENPVDVIRAASNQFMIDKWDTQPNRVEVWIEKDALAGVFSRVCNKNDIPYFSCRGYNSQSEMYYAAKRLYHYKQGGQTPIILHFGDRDPSGVDMTRDIIDRLTTFNYGYKIKVDRLALNQNQIDEFDPPPNPAKVTDSRYDAYVLEYGEDSFELDALPPNVLAGLVETAIKEFIDPDKWQLKVDEENEKLKQLKMIYEGYGEAVSMLNAPVCPLHQSRRFTQFIAAYPPGGIAPEDESFCYSCNLIFPLDNPMGEDDILESSPDEGEDDY